MITTITHVTLFVNSQDEALAFYTKKLGFEVHTDAMFGPDMRWLTLNAKGNKGFELVLFQANTLEQKALVGKQGASEVFMCLATDSIDDDYQEMKNRGVEFVGAPEDQPWGRSVVFKDLYGNNLYMVQAGQ